MVPGKAWTEEYLRRTRDYFWDKDFIPVLLKFLGVSRARRVLDVGSGLGYLARLIESKARKAEEIYGIDLDGSLLRAARKYGKQADSIVKYRKMDASEIKFKDGSFDFVAAMTLFVNVTNPDEILREMIRVTGPNGTIAALEPIYQTDGRSEYMPGYTESEYRFMNKLLSRRKRAATFVKGSDKYVAPRLPNMFAELGLKDVKAKAFAYAHLQKWDENGYDDYLDYLRKRSMEMERLKDTPENVLDTLPTNSLRDAKRYIGITKRRADRILRNPAKYRSMIYSTTYTILAVKGKKT